MTMGPGQIKARRKWILGHKKRKMIAKRPHHAWALHQRGYHNGDIKCVKCDTWINEKNWKEAVQIKVGPTGKKTHDPRYCNSNGMYAAAFSTMPKYSIGRRRRVAEVKRY